MTTPHKDIQEAIRAVLLPYGERIKGHLKGSPEYISIIAQANHHIKGIFTELEDAVGPIWNSGQQVVGTHIEDDLSHTLVYKIN